MSIEFFNFPSKVGEVIMKYFRAMFMQFTNGNYNFGIMMSCAISLLLFIMSMEFILWSAVDTAKGLRDK